jgi:competence protein ComEC
MHLAIVAAIIAFFLKRPLGLKKAALVGAVFIVFYVYLVGASASLERSAIMYLIGVFAIVSGCSTGGILLLGISFLIQLAYKPASADSVSFILSYSALVGILTLGKVSLTLLRGKIPMCAASSLAVSIGAFLATMTITIGYFGELRIAGLICGLPLVPLTTVFMAISIAFLVLTPVFTVLPQLKLLLSFVQNRIYDGLDIITKVACRFPGIESNNVMLFLLLNIVIVFAIYRGYFLLLKRQYGLCR